MFREGMRLLIHTSSTSSNPPLGLCNVDKMSSSSSSSSSSRRRKSRANVCVATNIWSLYESENQKTIGVIGGVSVLSTLIFLEKLVLKSSKAAKQPLPFVVCSDPSVTREFVSSSCHTCFPCSQIVENLRSKRTFLEQSGAACIVMPCHISHGWHHEISQGCLLPFLHVGDCVATQLKEAKLKPIEAGSHVRIGILEAYSCANFYQQKLQNQGFEVVLPDKATRDHILIPAIEALKRKDMEGARNLVRIAIHIFLMRAVNVVILASDEFQNLLPCDDPVLKKCIDPMDALVTSTITWATNKHKLSETE